MTAYAVVEDMKGYFGWLRINATNQTIFQEASLQEYLEQEATRIRNEATVLQYTLPVTPDAPPSAVDLFLELLNLERPAANLLVTLSSPIPPESLSYARAINNRAEFWWKLYCTNEMWLLFDTAEDPLPTDGLIAYADVLERVPGLGIGAGPTPSQAQIDRIAQRFSIPVYTILRIRGLVLDSFTAEQTRIIAAPVLDWTVATVLRSKGMQNVPPLYNTTAIELEVRAMEYFKHLLWGRYDQRLVA